jgi:predicted nucleotidyltransferase
MTMVRQSEAGTHVQSLVNALQPYHPSAVYLFGSHAAGTAHEQSDIDPVVIKATRQPFLERLKEVAALLPLSSGAVDVVVYAPEEFATMLAQGNAFAEMIREEAQLIYTDVSSSHSEPGQK